MVENVGEGRLSLNIFANVCEVDPGYYTLFPAMESFEQTFGRFHGGVTVFVHPEPLTRHYPQYERDIAAYYADRSDVRVVKTKGLADGYKRSIVEASTPYLFQLEHDWIFETALIKHSLTQILDAMFDARADYFRFGKEPNSRNKYGHKFVDAPLDDIPACAVTWRSNNPHIIDAAAYREKYLQFIDLSIGGSSGVEECLPSASGAYVYGPPDYPPTLGHTNGRTRLIQFRKSIGKIAYGGLKASGLLETAFRTWLQSNLAEARLKKGA